MLTEPLKAPLTRLEDNLSKEALDIFNMVGWLAFLLVHTEAKRRNKLGF